VLRVGGLELGVWGLGFGVRGSGVGILRSRDLEARRGLGAATNIKLIARTACALISVLFLTWLLLLQHTKSKAWYQATRYVSRSLQSQYNLFKIYTLKMCIPNMYILYK